MFVPMEALRKHGLASQTPERPCEPEACDQRLRLVEGSAPPCGFHLAAVPLLGQTPCLIERQDTAQGLTPLRAPAADMLLVPEEQHGLSTEDDVLPPSPGGHTEVDRSFSRNN